MGKGQYIWVTALPMIFVGVITLTGCYELWGLFLHRASSATDSLQVTTMYVNAGLVGLVGILALIVMGESSMRWYGYLVQKRPYTSTEIIEGDGIQLPSGPCC
jgi:carbon starvation protein